LTSHVVQRKRPCCTCPDVVSSQPLSPPDKSPKESPSTTYPKRPPSNFLITRGCPRDRSHGQSPSTNSVKRTPAQDSNPEPATDRVLASSRTRISSPPVIVGAQRPWCVPPECDLRHQRILPPPRVIFNKTSERKHSHTKSNREACPVQWDRTIRSLDPVRGITRRSIPPPFHWLEEKCPETSSQEPWMFFFFLHFDSTPGCPAPFTTPHSLFLLFLPCMSHKTQGRSSNWFVVFTDFLLYAKH
jgi:hypothetical protein